MRQRKSRTRSLVGPLNVARLRLLKTTRSSKSIRTAYLAFASRLVDVEHVLCFVSVLETRICYAKHAKERPEKQAQSARSKSTCEHYESEE